jgi:hypothetical protein
VSPRSGLHPTGTSALLDFPDKKIDRPQQGKGFGVREHIQNLHPSNSNPDGRRRGVVTFAQHVPNADKSWREWTVPTGTDAIQHAEELIRRGDATDLYLSQATFGRWRSIADLTAIGANFVDLDYHKQERWCRYSPRDVATAVVGMLDEETIPLPSCILSTGRGLCCLWFTELLPIGALSRWNAVQRHLADVLKPFGADMRALDAARVFRVVGSINSRAERDRRHVEIVWHQGLWDAPNRYEFGSLADEVLPFTRAELISLRAERATRKAKGLDGNIRPVQKLTEASYYSMAFQDLQSLRKHREPGSGALSPGHRDVWIFLAAVALSWIAAPEAMESEIRILAAQAAGWTGRETDSRMGAVFKRAKLSAQGKLLKFDGRDVNPRYRMRASTVVEWLGIEPSEMRNAGLRVLVDSDRRRELNTERSAKSRRNAGAKARDEQQRARLQLGQKALNMSSVDGLSVRTISAQLGVSVGQVVKAMKEARDAC